MRTTLLLALLAVFTFACGGGESTATDSTTEEAAEPAPEEGKPEPTRYFKAEIEEIRLLAHWLYVNREVSQKIDWQQDQDEAEMVGEVMAFLQGIPVE